LGKEEERRRGGRLRRRISRKKNSSPTLIHLEKTCSQMGKGRRGGEEERGGEGKMVKRQKSLRVGDVS